MLKSLLIKNYALIEKLEIQPSKHLNVITGETGAGKSIMLGATGLLLGNRVDKKFLFDADHKCVVEGIFDVSSYKLQKLFESLCLDFEDECSIRREITPLGKSRAFVNDTPVNLEVIKTIGKKLMDIHSQHESLHMGNQEYQLSIIDAFAAHHSLLVDYQEAYKNYKSSEKTLKALEKQAQDSRKDQDYKLFQLKELEEAKLDNVNQEQMEKELELLENAENIKSKLSQIHHLLDESELSVLQQLKESTTLLQSISVSKNLEELANRIESSFIELSDIDNEIKLIQDRTEHDPDRIATIKEQLDLVFQLQKKHNVLQVEELIRLRDQLKEQLSTVANLDNDIKEAQVRFETHFKLLLEKSQILSDSRKLYSMNLADEVEKVIHDIGIENGKIEIRLKEQEPQITGIDQVEILFSANKGMLPQPLKEVASGGELSRLIFAIKYLIAGKIALPTIIFDEIETGVSGQVALQMIAMMQKIAKEHQVISISHLPQFAAGGDAHFFVYKDHTSDRSVSKMRQLRGEGRILEIAKMISGKTPGESALRSAKELLETHQHISS